jgi:hypothetical protein
MRPGLTGATPRRRPIRKPACTQYADDGCRDQGGFNALPISGPSGQWAVIQPTYHDFNNAYALPAVVSNLEAVPVSFASNLAQQGLTSAPTINYTSLNLIYGGLFDINATWTPPHCGHRLGNEVDLGLSNIPLQDRRALAQAIKDNSFFFSYSPESPGNPSTNHWHLQAQ